MATVLVVDDESSIRAAVEEILSLDGHTVLSTEDGEGGLLLLGTACPDLVLVDLLMPGVDGRAFLRERQERGLCLDVPVVVLTGGDLPPAAIEQLLRAGATAYLGKPFDLLALSEVVARLTGSTA